MTASGSFGSSGVGGSRRRAVSDEGKQQRRAAIIAAALAALVDTPYEQITVAQLATRLGLAKGTLYLYFSTKEALFLEIQQQELSAWFSELASALTASSELGPEQLADLLTGSLIRRALLPRLLTVLHSVLERNISQAQALSFKLFLYTEVTRAAQLLEAKLPALAAGPSSSKEPGKKPGKGIDLLLRLHALVIGAWQVANPSTVVKEAIASRAELAVFDLSFAELLRDTMRALVRGMATAPTEPTQ